MKNLSHYKILTKKIPHFFFKDCFSCLEDETEKAIGHQQQQPVVTTRDKKKKTSGGTRRRHQSAKEQLKRKKPQPLYPEEGRERRKKARFHKFNRSARPVFFFFNVEISICGTCSILFTRRFIGDFWRLSPWSVARFLLLILLYSLRLLALFEAHFLAPFLPALMLCHVSSLCALFGTFWGSFFWRYLCQFWCKDIWQKYYVSKWDGTQRERERDAPDDLKERFVLKGRTPKFSCLLYVHHPTKGGRYNGVSFSLSFSLSLSLCPTVKSGLNFFLLSLQFITRLLQVKEKCCCKTFFLICLKFCPPNCT